jgi:hypothetical protein
MDGETALKGDKAISEREREREREASKKNGAAN